MASTYKTYTQTKYYVIPKEKVVNLLDAPVDFNADGSILSKPGTLWEVELYDYAIPNNIVDTPSLRPYIGKIGTRAVICGYRENYLKEGKEFVNKVLKQYEL